MNVLILLGCGLFLWNCLLTYMILNHLHKHEVFTALLQRWYRETSTKPVTQAAGQSWEAEQERLRYEGE